MKNKLLIILMIFAGAMTLTAPSEILVNDIRDVNGIIYYRDETVPFTGKIKDIKDRNYYLNGKPHGKWITFHPSGAMKSIENWENGKLNGKFVLYYENGTKIMETTYLNGEDNGKYILYHPNGKIQIKGQISTGKPYGLWEFYDENGTLTRKQNL
ncbi:MAG: toxin-antitoxin system YwqK family antitoxin [Fusobacteriaceae bacterium]|jgi:antitoxin component YwqK of YwqJK toxin-antitoxin module|nr:toxin-antitoxin system YwqK family antitoxin [Fusobacteriaceae bacterium]